MWWPPIGWTTNRMTKMFSFDRHLNSVLSSDLSLTFLKLWKCTAVHGKGSALWFDSLYRRRANEFGGNMERMFKVQYSTGSFCTCTVAVQYTNILINCRLALSPRKTMICGSSDSRSKILRWPSIVLTGTSNSSPHPSRKLCYQEQSAELLPHSHLIGSWFGLQRANSRGKLSEGQQ